MKSELKNFFHHHKNTIYSVTASAIIAGCLNFHIIAELGRRRFAVSALIYFIIIFCLWLLVKSFYQGIVKYLKLSDYWLHNFAKFLDSLFLIFAGFFFVALSNNEYLSLVIIAILGAFLYWRLHTYFAEHLNAQAWQAVNRIIFLLSAFIFSCACVFQTYAYKNYFLEIKHSGTALNFTIALRSLEITLFWLGLFSLTAIAQRLFKKNFRYIFLGTWLVIFIGALILSVFNIGLLRFSGLNLDPSMIHYAQGSGDLFKNNFLYLLIIFLLILLFIFYKTLIKIKKLIQWVPKKYWYAYNIAIIIFALLVLVTVPFYRNTPEYLIAKSFYNYYFVPTPTVNLDAKIITKLNKFGLIFNADGSPARHEQVFNPAKKYLPAKFNQQKPNVIIFFLESFSSRLTSVYNPTLKDLTPGLNAMSEDKNTTVFYNYYNASTPTLTGITSQLCSILPPTGQKGVTAGGAIRYNTPCLPEILKEQGYKYSNYITAVEKNYSGKGEVIADMGTDEIYGTEELRRIIKNEPLSWGYSDHQMMPVMINMAKTKAQPFLIMLSSVDTHPPFNQAKDGVIYDDGKSNLLNSVHTTDDAFAKFWQEFKASPLADNTIVITVADHAIFPASYASEAEKKLLAGNQGQITFYDQNLFMIYLPDTTLPKKIDTYAMGIDFTPTLLQILNVNIPNYFEGMSILDNRKNYPNLLGMNEYELYINAQGADGKRDLQYGPPGSIKDLGKQEERLTLYEYLQYYNFKKEKLK